MTISEFISLGAHLSYLNFCLMWRFNFISIFHDHPLNGAIMWHLFLVGILSCSMIKFFLLHQHTTWTYGTLSNTFSLPFPRPYTWLRSREKINTEVNHESFSHLLIQLFVPFWNCSGLTSNMFFLSLWSNVGVQFNFRIYWVKLVKWDKILAGK